MQIAACYHMISIHYYLASLNFTLYKPIAYQCSDYDAFLRGECTDCGAQEEKCAILGEEAISSSKFKNLTMGKRFYLLTTDDYPYLSRNSFE